VKDQCKGGKDREGRCQDRDHTRGTEAARREGKFSFSSVMLSLAASPLLKAFHHLLFQESYATQRDRDLRNLHKTGEETGWSLGFQRSAATLGSTSLHLLQGSNFYLRGPELQSSCHVFQEGAAAHTIKDRDGKRAALEVNLPALPMRSFGNLSFDQFSSLSLVSFAFPVLPRSAWA
jgi:hypothetical protein